MFEWLGRCHGSPAASLSSGWRCTQRRAAGAGVPAGCARIFDEGPPPPLISSLSDHYNSPGRLTEYKRQFYRVVRRPGDYRLETLARRAFIDIDISIQIQMVRDRCIDGQAECALRRNLDSLGPDTPMSDIVDCCWVWESHRDVETEPRMSADRRPAHAVCQVAVDEQIPTASPETETLENIIKKLLPTPVPTE